MVGNVVVETLFSDAIQRGERVRCCVVTAPGGHGKTALAESLVTGLAERDIASVLLTGDVVPDDTEFGDSSVIVVDAADRAPVELLERLRVDVLSPESARSVLILARSATASPELAELAALADRDDRLGQVGPLSIAELADRIPSGAAISAQLLHDMTGGVPAHVDRLCAGWDEEGWPSSPEVGSVPERFRRHGELLMTRLTSEARVMLATLSITQSSALDGARSEVTRALLGSGLVDQNGRVPDAIGKCVDGALDESEKARAMEAAGIELLRSDPARAAALSEQMASSAPWAAAALAAAGRFGQATSVLNAAWDESDGIMRAAAAHVAAAESRWTDAARHAASVHSHPYWTDGQIAGVTRLYGVLDGAVSAGDDTVTSQEPAARFIDDAVAVLASTLDPAADVDVVGDRLRALVRQSSNQQPMLDVAVSPAELAAVAALISGEFGVAKALIDSSAEVNDRSALNASLAEWVSVRAGHESDDGSARSALRPEPDESTAMVAATVLELAARVMTTRRSGDSTDQMDVLGEIDAVGAALSVDVLTFDALCELHLGAQRIDARLEAQKLASGMDGLIDRLGAPQLWDVRRRWNQVESAVAAGDADALKAAADHLAALCVDRPGAPGSHLAAAAQQWVRVFAGQIDKRTLVECLDDLESRGYVWEAAALAGQAAIRTTNAEMARELLQRGREYRQAVPERTVTSPAGLSEREIEIGQHVLTGHSYKEIGAMCFISPKTVEHHIAHIRQKLSVVGVSRAEFRAALEADLGYA